MMTEVSFSSGQLVLLNAILALMIFGVSLGLKPGDFARILKAPKAPITGLAAQFILLPAFTSLGIWWLAPDPAIALGMLLVAACPGGNFSNIMTWIARGDVAVSVSMTAVSSLAAVVLTPFNFAFYASLNPVTQPLVSSIAIDPWQMISLFVLVLIIPLALGMLVGARFPRWVDKTEAPFRIISMLILFVFVGIALWQNLDAIALVLGPVILWVIVHNAFALGVGNLSARLLKLRPSEQRAITLEVGIQNSALGLAILFTFFADQRAMILVAGFWGIWHLVTGTSLAYFWSRRAPAE
ncbi:bile acid:sodium symporter family protein [Simiduia agarivorans]|uniref:Bile acid:sodium symporter n=1 Tax=Simiduia agarivorans (strain DSM 21679 / JCM 13881 / BCRC 17597 / SA1) TaxID=1117647 RepID=K4KJN7_SIMAS|nr:bile acid:sodium symporter family protein [Simiduia agarivorans]AFU98440.1 bile acid:sodium symporter [Simiduia agarivorans SA1 = DSM 21679]